MDIQCIENPKDQYEVEKNTDCVLELLDEVGVKATFFFVGRTARDVPKTVRRVALEHHEVACHSYRHLRIFGVAKNEFKQKLGASKKRLEDVSGKQIFGFRAPEFSIIESSRWALDVLHELGFAYDSSICPIGFHDVYGIPNAKPFIHRLSNGLVEFPPATIEILRKRFPFGGGGYFRLYPLLVTERCLSHMDGLGHPCMLYIHPYEVGPIVPVVPNLSVYRTFRHYYNCDKGAKRLRKLLQVFSFAPAVDILRDEGYLHQVHPNLLRPELHEFVGPS